MRKSQFTEQKMVRILREADRAPVADVAKKHGISDQTIYAWRKRFGNMTFVVGQAAETERVRIA